MNISGPRMAASEKNKYSGTTLTNVQNKKTSIKRSPKKEVLFPKTILEIPCTSGNHRFHEWVLHSEHTPST